MTYKITYTYETGNTFDHEDTEGEFEYKFDSEELAQEALQRMREHYDWQFSVDNYREEDVPQPKWWTRDPSAAKYLNNWSFNVMGNDGEEVWLYGGSYLGYFETLYEAEVVSTKTLSNKSKFTLRGY
jgi:hypothetical protein